jgi:2-(1,2-epoxy-1,2-dihydrophenyl)acetyl-CoA isomerase
MGMLDLSRPPCQHLDAGYSWEHAIAPLISTQADGAVETVTMTGSALTGVARRELLAALRAAIAVPPVRAIVLTGTGAVFCAGQDLTEHAEALRRDAATAVESLRDEYGPLISEIVGAPKPVVAAINGTCAGGGLGLALACDIRIAIDTARFVPAFAAIGLAPDCGVSSTLARAVGPSRAREILMLSRSFSGTEAQEWGLVSAAVRPDLFASTVADTAAGLAAGSAMALAATKQLLDAAATAPLDEMLQLEYERQRELAQTDEHRQAVQAFLARRVRG